MKKIIHGLYIVWVAFWFLAIFLLIYPFIFIIIQNKKWHYLYFYITRFWGIAFYAICGLSVKSTWQFKPDKNQTYIYCPNHFSYLDIPLMTWVMPRFFIFVGLHDLENIPLFGYMYKNIHITVNRGSLRNRYLTYQRCKEAIDEKKNLVIFPEGGIWSEDFPHIAPFKEGPFRVAIEKQIPIVPVTIPYNWVIMPLMEYKKFKRHRSEVIFHTPIETKGLTLKDIEQIKESCFETIDRELKSKFNLEEKKV